MLVYLEGEGGKTCDCGSERYRYAWQRKPILTWIATCAECHRPTRCLQRSPLRLNPPRERPMPPPNKLDDHNPFWAEFWNDDFGY